VEEKGMDRESHPVWEVYDLHRLARLRNKYYCAELARAKRYNNASEIFLAATVSGSAVGTLAFWSTATGMIWWQALAACSAALAVAKPFFRLADRIQEADESVTGYRLIEQRITRLESGILNERGYTPAHKRRFIAIMEDLEAVVLKQPKASDSAAWIKKYTDEVNNELPSDKFYIP
jgi:hypothetical protein